MSEGLWYWMIYDLTCSCNCDTQCFLIFLTFSIWWMNIELISDLLNNDNCELMRIVWCDVVYKNIKADVSKLKV